MQTLFVDTVDSWHFHKINAVEFKIRVHINQIVALCVASIKNVIGHGHTTKIHPLNIMVSNSSKLAIQKWYTPTHAHHTTPHHSTAQSTSKYVVNGQTYKNADDQI